MFGVSAQLCFQSNEKCCLCPPLMLCGHLSCPSQTLPKIDLDSYSVVPVDEGDEDRDAETDDDIAGSDSDLDLGDGDSEEGLALRK